MQTLTLTRCFACIPAGASRTCLLGCFLMLLACWHTQAHAQTVTPLPPALYPTQNQLTGLFYNPAESGYGCNSIAQANPKFAQSTVAMPESRNILFVTCFIYDAQGKPAWLVASDVRDGSGTGSYRGLLYRTASAGFGVNFNPNAVGVTAVGEIELNFAKVFDVKLTLRIKDPQGLLIVNGNQDNAGGVNVLKNVKRQVWGQLPLSVEYAQEMIIPQGVQMKVPSVELASTCLKVTDTCFYQAVQNGTALLIDTGVKITGNPRDLVYAVYRTKVHPLNGVTEWSVIKSLYKDTLLPPNGNEGVIESAIVVSPIIDRFMGTSGGMLVRSTNARCHLIDYNTSAGGLQVIASNACPIWN